MALVIEVKVVPSSGKSEWQLSANGRLKCFLKSNPEKGAANKELIKTLSKLLRISQMKIEIISGLTERNKRIMLHSDLTYLLFLEKVRIHHLQKRIDS